MNVTVSLEEFRKNLSDIVSRVMYGNQTILVQKHSKSGIVVMSEQEYENLRDPRKRFTTEAEWNSFFNLVQKIRSKMSEGDEKELDRIIAEEIAAARANNKKRPANAL